MEVLHILEQKIAFLLNLIQDVRAENARLVQENVQLNKELKALECSVESDEELKEKLNREKELTKVVVDGLIERINSLTMNELKQ